MFESDDWIFQDLAFDEVEEETRRKSRSPCEKGAKKPSIKRRRLASCGEGGEALESAPTDSTLQLDIEDSDHVSRGDFLLGIFQKTSSPEARNFANDPSEMQTKETQSFQSQVDATSRVFRHKSRKSVTKTSLRLAKEVKLIRMFPGPAGLVQDVKSDNIPTALSYLSGVDELENKTATKVNRRVEVKSQDEKNLVGEKAWRLLLNDLPKNFLHDYKISVVKEKANASRCDSTRVRFLAGVLDYVDHSHDDPFVVLKDSTGKIEGTIHRDIPLTYPGILEPNVVILLRDVGLIKTTTYVVTNKYHILVSLVNLLAIYSDKGRIVSTSFMESILSRTSNVQLNRINNCPTTSKPPYISGLQKMDESRAPLQTSSSIDSLSPSSFTKDYEFELAKDPRNPLLQNRRTNDSYSIDTDDLDMDVFFTDCDFATLEEQNRLIRLDRSPSKSISQATKIQRCDLQVQNTRHLKENMKNESNRNVEKQVKEQCLPQTLQKCISDVKTCGTNTRYSRKNDFSSCDDTASGNSNLNVKSALPPMKRNIRNSSTLVSYFTNNKCDEYDSDDEILSQLDVDNIFDKPKKDC